MTDGGLWRGDSGPHRASLHRLQCGWEQGVVSDHCPHGLQSGEMTQGWVLRLRQYCEVGKVAFIWKGHGKTIMMTILSLVGETAAAPERDPEPCRKLVPAPTVVPAAASEPELENPITAAGAQQLKSAGTHLPFRAQCSWWSEL